MPRNLIVALSFISLLSSASTAGKTADHLPLARFIKQQSPLTASAPNDQDVTVLEPNKPIERELSGGQSHTYQITLTEGQYLKVIVEQRGIDVVVRLLDPNGKQVAEFDAEIRKQGQEVVSQVAEVTGRYRLEVEAKEKVTPTRNYGIHIEELRAAMKKDHALQEARKLSTEFVRLYLTNKYDEARPLAERALEIREKELGLEHPDVARALSNLATLYRAKSDFVKAEPLYQRALAIFERTLGSEHPDVATSLSNLATLFHNEGDSTKAELLLQRALGIREKALGPEHPDVARLLYNLAILSQGKGNFALAEQLYQRVLMIREKTLGPEHTDLIGPLNNLAVIYRGRDNFAKAEQLHQRVLAIREKLLGPNHLDVASSLNNLGYLYQTKGEYAKAEPLHQRALAIREKNLGPEHPAVSASLDNLAILYHDKGDLAKAEPLYQRALAIREKVFGPEHLAVADTLNNLATLYRDKTDLARAEWLHQRALTIKEKILGPEHSAVASSLNNLAILYRDRGSYEKAESLQQRALAIWEKANGPEHSTVADALNNLAYVYHDKGDLAKAEPLYQRALAIREKVFGLTHPAVAQSLYNLAMLYEMKDDIAQAITFRSRASTISERDLALNLATGSERQKLVYLATLSEYGDQTISLHARVAPNDPVALNLAATTILRRKGRVLDTMSNGLATLRQRFNAQDQALLDQLKETYTQLANLVLGGPQKMTPAEHQKLIADLEEQREKVEAEISRRSDEFRTQAQPVTLAAVQSAIPAGAALIEFAAYHPFNAKATKNEVYAQPHYVAYILRRQGEIQWRELGEMRTIDEAITALRQALRDPQRGDIKELARAVEEKIFQPLRPLLGETMQVLLSPDGALNLIPFAALVDEQGRYLIERYSFTYLTSGRDLLRLQVARESQRQPLILADPAFGEPQVAPAAKAKASPPITAQNRKRQSVTTGTDLSSVYFAPLAGTAVEAQTIKSLFPAATVLSRNRATEAALKQVTSPRILHIATHGFFLDDQPVKPEGARDEGKARGLSANVKIENPLLRSGLALAGANLHRGGDDDGLLTALEAAGLNLWGTKLVVLSACDTGVGEVRTGEGVYGLRRALVLAGAETQVMTLWPVRDDVTCEMMKAYYTGLMQGQGRGEALRQTQLKMRQRPGREHPFYWAGVIQSGAWASLDSHRQ